MHSVMFECASAWSPKPPAAINPGEAHGVAAVIAEQFKVRTRGEARDLETPGVDLPTPGRSSSTEAVGTDDSVVDGAGGAAGRS